MIYQETTKHIVKKPGEFRKGKTKRDKASGAWAQRLANQSARAEEQKAKPKRK